MKKSIFILSLLLFLNSLSAQEKSPTNIILMIGDGMGLSQVTTGMYYNGNKTALENFPTIGLSKTHASNSLVTDSAASGTAMACGVKTLNGVVGISSKNEKKESILKISKNLGYQTGLIATSSIVHARNLLKEMSDFDITSTLKKFDKSEASKIGHFTNDDEPVKISEGRLPLKNAVTSVLNKLDRDQKPFFLMVEGSQIDWGGHANEVDYVVSEFNDFDAAIQTVLDFTIDHPNTLVIVTADHETGGLSIPKGDIKTMEPVAEFSTLGHTATMVPVYSRGPSAETFSGIYDNTAIFSKMLDVLNQ